ncbi:MAG: hypothetical protein M5T52_24010 [Ignavibacteriaceae bacterium]|nr:hypothetical protein [Ignavibacteriaceae bacterium]
MEGLNNINNEMPNIGGNADPLQAFKNFSAEDMEKIKLLAGLLGIEINSELLKKL